MADALISPTVGGVMAAAAASALAYSVYKMKKENATEKIPVMGVMGAFVFAAQMINFTIPVTGSSGHIGGGILLSAVLGGPAAMISITSVLIIQALFFADGGLLALGCNIFNMGVVACLAAYPLLFKPILKKNPKPARIMAASVVSAVVGLQAGAFAVVLETLASEITALPFGAFVALMQPIHLAIGAVEGVVTGAVLIFIYGAQPSLPDFAVGLEAGAEKKPAKIKRRTVIIAVAAAAVIIGGGLSLFASSFPDGLEWSIEGVTGSPELESGGGAHGAAAAIQQSSAFLPDYGFGGAGDSEIAAAAGTSVSGIVGGALTAAAAAGAGAVIYIVRKKKIHG